MTSGQVREAIAQMKVQCDLKMASYEGVSARSALVELGYTPDEQAEVILAIAKGGFTYCLDPLVPSTTYVDNPDAVTRFPDADVCYWGPDQLKSRLECVHVP